jgi:hypothetical protein
MIMIEAEWPTLTSRAPKTDGSSPVVIFVYVEDVDKTVQQATANGAQVFGAAGESILGRPDSVDHGSIWTRRDGADFRCSFTGVVSPRCSRRAKTHSAERRRWAPEKAVRHCLPRSLNRRPGLYTGAN